jgi:hypothetical protein
VGGEGVDLLSASRTLLRRNKHYGETIDAEGEFVARPKRTKPGTPHRRILAEIERVIHGRRFEFRYHATKGYRSQEVPL